MDDKKEMGQRIRALRLKLGLTQDELAKELGYKSRSTINKIELGVNEVHPLKVYSFANALKTSPEYLFGQKANPQEPENIVEFKYNKGDTFELTLNDEDMEKAFNFVLDLIMGDK